MRIRRLLIANRGEIAVRIIRACREMGIETVAVHSTADAGAAFVTLADQAHAIGPPPATESYLKIPAILDVARRTQADAVHPGYGFLAENAAFAAACADAGLIFVGPSARVIEQMGSKLGARDLMERAGVPVVPGARPDDQTEAGVKAAALDSRRAAAREGIGRRRRQRHAHRARRERDSTTRSAPRDANRSRRLATARCMSSGWSSGRGTSSFR